MPHRLAAILAAVIHNAVAFFQSQLLGKLGRSSKDVSKQRTVFLCQLVGRGDVFLWNDQNVYRCLRIQIIKGQNLVILIGLFRRDFPGSDFAKNTIRHTHSPYFIRFTAALPYVCLVHPA